MLPEIPIQTNFVGKAVIYCSFAGAEEVEEKKANPIWDPSMQWYIISVGSAAASISDS